MESGSLLASRYAPARERAYHLGILTGQGVSAWAVHALEDGAPLALVWAGGNAALDDTLLPEHPVSISFVSLPEWSTLVPDGALAPGSEARHLALVHGSMPTGAMRDEPVRSLGATCIYVHDDRLERSVLDRFPNARALPMQAVMVRSAMARSFERPAVLLHRSVERADVAIAREGDLLLSNAYPTRSAQDLLYFLLLAVERCGSTPAAVDLYVGGTHLSALERDLLTRYFEHIRPAASAPWADQGHDQQDPADRWWAALEQFPCVS